jgi:hypothetical protein
MDKYDEPDDMSLTWCNKCSSFKDPELFNGTNAHCNDCISAYNRTRPKVKDTRIRIRAKGPVDPFDEDDFERLLKEQDGKCAICLTDKCSSGFRLAVDHNHETGKIRGLLCRDCNQVLGKFKEDIDRFLRAAMYLNLHK